MHIVDSHLHSKYSYDSKVEFNEYIEILKSTGRSILFITDHFDIEPYGYRDNTAIKDTPIIPDIDAEIVEINQLSVENGIEILLGIEIGYMEHRNDDIVEFLSKYRFDSKLLSFHDSKMVDYYTIFNFDLQQQKQILIEYFEIMLRGIKKFQDFDILTHIEFAFRKSTIDEYEFALEKVDEVLKEIIKMDKSLEYNAGSKIQKPIAIKFQKEVFQRYYNLGGRRVTYGSDGHVKTDIYTDVDEIASYLKDIGYTHVTYYRNRLPVDIKL